MTDLTRMIPAGLARALLLCAPVALLAACAVPAATGPCDPCAAAAHAQATADEALTTARQALAAANAARESSSEMYQRSLRK